ncbi:MAG: 30S ribosomal protein S1 [Firmicutes bacterium]|nr:30S ribosomal protein S1 [Bacillota bacterium]
MSLIQQLRPYLPEGLKEENIKKFDRSDEIIMELHDAWRNGTILEGRIVGSGINAVGRIVKVIYQGMEFIMPEDELDPSSRTRVERFLGREVYFKVVGVDLKEKKAVFSRKAAIEDRSNATLESIKIGQVWTGKAVIVDQRHAILDIGGGITAILSRDDFAYTPVKDLREQLKLGEGLDVKIIDIDYTRTNRLKNQPHIQVSLKEVLNDPWELVKENINFDELRVGTVTGHLVDRRDPLVFVRIDPGGIIVACPVSNRALPAKGQEIIIKIKKIDPVRRRLFGVYVANVSAI